MKTLHDYLSDVEKTFKFRIKSIYEIDDDAMNVIEHALMKYRPSDISRPKKLMFQTVPLGFSGAKNVELFIVDVTTTVPVASIVMQSVLRNAFGLQEGDGAIQVIGEHDQFAANGQMDDEPVKEEDETAEDKTALLLDPEYKEAADINADDYFGDNYNKKFLSYVNKVAAEHISKKKVDAPHPITKWESQPKPEMSPNFNDTVSHTGTRFPKGSKK